MRRWQWLWRNLMRRSRVEDELEEEVRAYEALREDELAQSGLDRAAARREVRLEGGGADRIKEEVRDVRLGTALELFAADLRLSLRALRRSPSLTLTGVAMLALGMGAATVVFSVFHTALLKPLPFRDPDRIVELRETRPARGIDRASFSEANFWDVRARNRSFREMGAWHNDEANLTGMGEAEKVSAVRVTAGFFRALGVSPVLGRDFNYDEERSGESGGVTMLGNRFWRTRFGADPKVLGKALRLNGRSYTVIGVLPAGEPWMDEKFYLPFGYRANADRGSWEFGVVARLADGITADAARADLQGIGDALSEAYPREDKGMGFRIRPASDWVANDSTRRALRVLLSAVGFLMLIACLNLANLLLARGMARQREIAVRTTLGAGQSRLVRFVMMEALLLSGFGALLGAGLGYFGLHALQAMEVRGIPRLADASLNAWVLGFAALLAILTGILSGLAPALQVKAGGIAAALRQGTRQTAGRSQMRLRAALVTAEVAFSFLLLVGAGLLIRSFTQLASVQSGFQTEGRLVFSVNLPDSYFRQRLAKPFVDRLFERLSAMPQVAAAGAVNTRPVEGWDPGMSIDSAAGASDPGRKAAPWAGWRIVSPGYFRAAGLTLLRGRLFKESDPSVFGERGQPAPQRRVVISEGLAKVIFAGRDPVGDHATLWKGQSGMDAEVIGVVADTRERGLNNQPPFTVYLPYGANAVPTEFVVQTHGNPLDAAPQVRAIVAGLDANLPVSDVRAFEEVVQRSVAPQRVNATLLAIFSGLALMLATTGIYGVLAYSMSQRTSEIGLRVALGASGGSILKLAIGQGMRPALVGMLLGAGGSVWLSRYLAALLVGVKPLDVATYTTVAALLLAAALVACYVPGRRAMRTDPAVALRVE
jgi:putative ABC transport system permease protein